jgi:branched-subunit amino acid transport protein
MNVWLMILGMMVVTFGVRYPMLAIVGRLPLPPNVIRALRFVPVAVLTAIIVPMVIMPKDSVDLSLTNPNLIAGVLALIAAWRTKNLLLSILIGMGAYLLLRTVIGG